jgi:peptide deformylase
MSEELFVIDTEKSVQKNDVIKPLPLYDENHPMLDDEIPEYIDALPNAYMNNLIQRLKMTMKLYGGIGLSANQCGVYERVFIIGTDDFQMTCINPKVIEVSAEIIKDSEGCLSFPGLFLKIERPKSVLAEYINEFGQVEKKWIDGITARCYLHELDHMNGVKYTSKVGKVSMMQGRRKQEKLIKKIKRKNQNGV